jgi:hypothetical protein
MRHNSRFINKRYKFSFIKKNRNSLTFNLTALWVAVAGPMQEHLYPPFESLLLLECLETEIRRRKKKVRTYMNKNAFST